MKNLRVEITDEGTALYVAVDPDGLWAKTTRPDKLITIDWDRQGRVIGIEAIGSAARGAIEALLQALADYPARDRDKLHVALEGLVGGSPASAVPDREAEAVSYQEAAGQRGPEWVRGLAKAQASFTRELASASPAAATSAHTRTARRSSRRSTP